MFVEQGFKKEIDVKTLPNNLEGFIAWLETKNPNETYDWFETKRCAVAQFQNAIGIKDPDLCETFGQNLDEYQIVGFGDFRPFVKEEMVAFGSIAKDFNPGWTFGQCLERAKAALAARSR